MQDMERALEQEIKHRKQVQQKLEQECEERIAQVQREFESVIEERTSMMNKRLEILNERVSQLNSRIHEESARIPEDIEAKSRSLGEMLQNMQNDFLNERKVSTTLMFCLLHSYVQSVIFLFRTVYHEKLSY